MLAQSIVLLTNSSLSPDQDLIVEDIIWKSEIQLSHLPNTTNPNRKYSTGRIFSPLELQPLDAKLLPNYENLTPDEIHKIRGSLVESLFIAEQEYGPKQSNGQNSHAPEPGTENTTSPNASWARYLQILHSFLNYKAWLLWCAGDRSPLALQKSLLQKPESKLLYQTIDGTSYEALPHCRFFPSPIATADHLPPPVAGIRPQTLELYLDLHPTKNSLHTLRQLAQFGFNLVPEVRSAQIGGQQAYLIVEQGNLPTEGFAEAKTKEQKAAHLLPFAFISQIYVLPKRTTQTHTTQTLHSDPADPAVAPDGGGSSQTRKHNQAQVRYCPSEKSSPTPT